MSLESDIEKVPLLLKQRPSVISTAESHVGSELSSTTHSSQQAKSDGEKSNTIPKKRKQPPFLQRKVKVVNPYDINEELLLKKLLVSFEEKSKEWNSKKSSYALSHGFVTVFIIGLQLCQIVIFQIPSIYIDLEIKGIVATILPAVTASVLAIQMKLRWEIKGEICKRGAEIYDRLVQHVQYRMTMLQCGGRFEDSIDVWNAGLINEACDIPALFSAH